MNLTVRGPRVFIAPEKLPEMTEDGALHLVNYRAASTMKGVVVAVGSGPEFVQTAVRAVCDDLKQRIDNKYVHEAIDETLARFSAAHVVKVGDRVLFSPNAGTELFFERDLYVVLLEDDIMAVIE